MDVCHFLGCFLLLTSNSGDDEKCLRKIVDLYASKDDSILAFGDFLSDYPKYVYNYDKFEWHNYNYDKYEWHNFLPVILRFNVYMGVITEHEVISKIALLPNWESRGKFFLAYEGSLQELFAKLAEHYVYDVLVVQNGSVYTYFPYRFENINQPDTEPVLLGDCGMHWETLQPPKLPRLWRNTTLRVGYLDLPPYVMLKNGTGIDLELLADIIAPLLQVKLNYSTFGWWGYRINDTYTDTYGAMYMRLADCAIGSFHVQSTQQYYDFDVPPAHLMDSLHWFVHVADELEHWERLMFIFQPTMWTYFGATTTLLALTWIFTGKMARTEHQFYKSARNSVAIPLLLLIGQPMSRYLKSKPNRTLFAFTWLFTFILNTAWNTQLYSALTQTSYKRQIDTVSEIVRDLRITIPIEAAHVYLHHDKIHGRAIYEKNDIKVKLTPEQYFRNVAELKDVASISSSRTLRYMMPLLTSEEGYSLVHQFKHALNVVYGVLVFTKGHPCFETARKVILWTRSAGIVGQIERMVEHRVAISHATQAVRRKFKVKALSLLQIDDIFFLYLSGCTTALVCFITEVLLFRIPIMVGKPKYRFVL